MNVKEILLQTLLDPSSSETDKKQAADAIAKFDATTNNPAPKQPNVNYDAGSKMLAEIEARTNAHLAENAKYPEAIEVLIKAGQKLFAAAQEFLWTTEPKLSASERDLRVIPVLIKWMSDPTSAPEDAQTWVKYIKTARRYLNSVGVTWAVGGLDWPFGQKDNPFAPYEAEWYA